MYNSIWRNHKTNNKFWKQYYNLSNDYYLSFDKSNDGVQCASVLGNSVYDSVTPNAPFTINAYVYCIDNGESTLGTIFHKGHNTPTGINAGYQVHVFAGNSSRVRLGMNVRHGDGSDGQQATMADNSNSSTGALLRNTWQMVTMVYNGDGDKRIRGYVQGVEIASYNSRTAGTGDVRDDSARPLIIGNKDSGQVTWNGRIRDVKVFHGVALTPTEILDLFNGTIPLSLSSYYDFHEGRGYALHDIVGGGHGIIGAFSGSAGSPVFTPGSTGATWGIF